MKIYLKLIISLTSLILISSCTCSASGGFSNERTTHETTTTTYANGRVDKTEKKDKKSMGAQASINKTFLVKNANNPNIINNSTSIKNIDKEFDKLAKTKFDLMNRADLMLNSKLSKVNNQLKTREDSKAYYIDGDFKGMTPKNIKFSVKNNHVSITMDLEKKGKNFSQTSSFTRMFPLSHPVDESKIKTINKDGKLSITIPKL